MVPVKDYGKLLIIPAYLLWELTKNWTKKNFKTNSQENH